MDWFYVKPANPGCGKSQSTNLYQLMDWLGLGVKQRWALIRYYIISLPLVTIVSQ
jgi:hypothetical protein